MTLKQFITNKYAIILILILVVSSLAVFYFQHKQEIAQATVARSATSAISTDIAFPNPPYPDDFFSFDYEQNAFKTLRDQSLKSLVSNPIRYCGEGWYNEYNIFGDSKFVPQLGEVFDCKEFGTGSSLIKRVSHESQSVEKGQDKGLNLKTTSSYTIGKYKMTETTSGDIFSEVSDKLCRIKIIDGDKEIFKIESDEYSCGSVDSVEHDGSALLLFGGFSSGGNDYAGDERYFFYDGSAMHDLGSLIRQGYGSEKFWTKNGDFVFWVYDGRYEGSFRGSHNASTYAFIPRVFKIQARNRTVQIVEGPSISPEVKKIYQHDLDAIKESFSKAIVNNGLDKTSIEPFLVYWVGISRYLLSGQLLDQELNKISDVQKTLGLQGTYEEDSVKKLYPDIKGGTVSGLR